MGIISYEILAQLTNSPFADNDSVTYQDPFKLLDKTTFLKKEDLKILLWISTMLILFFVTPLPSVASSIAGEVVKKISSDEFYMDGGRKFQKLFHEYDLRHGRQNLNLKKKVVKKATQSVAKGFKLIPKHSPQFVFRIDVVALLTPVFSYFFDKKKIVEKAVEIVPEILPFIGTLPLGLEPVRTTIQNFAIKNHVVISKFRAGAGVTGQWFAQGVAIEAVKRGFGFLFGQAKDKATERANDVIDVLIGGGNGETQKQKKQRKEENALFGTFATFAHFLQQHPIAAITLIAGCIYGRKKIPGRIDQLPVPTTVKNTLRTFFGKRTFQERITSLLSKPSLYLIICVVAFIITYRTTLQKLFKKELSATEAISQITNSFLESNSKLFDKVNDLTRDFLHSVSSTEARSYESGAKAAKKTSDLLEKNVEDCQREKFSNWQESKGQKQALNTCENTFNTLKTHTASLVDELSSYQAADSLAYEVKNKLPVGDAKLLLSGAQLKEAEPDLKKRFNEIYTKIVKDNTKKLEDTIVPTTFNIFDETKKKHK
jgi:hypothetical protein